jgi:hypothetical protein
VALSTLPEVENDIVLTMMCIVGLIGLKIKLELITDSGKTALSKQNNLKGEQNEHLQRIQTDEDGSQTTSWR